MITIVLSLRERREKYLQMVYKFHCKPLHSGNKMANKKRVFELTRTVFAALLWHGELLLGGTGQGWTHSLGVYPVAPEHPVFTLTLDALFFVVHLLAVVVKNTLKIALLCEHKKKVACQNHRRKFQLKLT
jgi:hypothetical protein